MLKGQGCQSVTERREGPESAARSFDFPDLRPSKAYGWRIITNGPPLAVVTTSVPVWGPWLAL